MSLTDALLLLAFLLANMAIGATTLFLYSSVGTILVQRHPKVWEQIQGYTLAARNARARFYLSLGPFRLNDPALSRASVRALVATAIWVALGIGAFVTAAARGYV